MKNILISLTICVSLFALLGNLRARQIGKYSIAYNVLQDEKNDDLRELLRLHKQAQTAHLTYNAELFIELFADNLTQLARGNVITRNRAENLARFKNYFSSYKFIEWEDIKPPIIKISKDGTLAAITVEKRVRGTYKNEMGEEETDHTIFAWLEVWEKIDGKWKVTTVASTSKNGKK